MSRIACAWICVSVNCVIRPSRASPGFFACRISAITASRLSSAIFRPFEDVAARFRLPQLELGPAAHDLAPELDEGVDHLDERQHLRPPADDRQHDDAEAALQRGVLVQVVEDDLADLAALQVDDDPHAVAIRFVADVGNAFDGLLAHQFRDPLDQLRLVDLVGNRRRRRSTSGRPSWRPRSPPWRA